MITYVRGNVFESPAQTLVNTVNTVGVMGRGLALEFKRLYPEMFRQYREHCERGELTIGRHFFYRTEHKSVLNFPTKKHWRQPSRPEYIEEGLKTFVQTYERVGIHSVAFPALGCGNGGLDFAKQVQPLLEKYLKRVAAQVFIYPHQKSYHIPEHMDVDTMRRWLHTAPEDLPFGEVWMDLRDVLGLGRDFKTFAKESGTFVASIYDPATGPQQAFEGIEQGMPGLKIEKPGKAWLIPYDDLAEFWQQLRTFGFVSSQSAPANRAKDASYIAPVFAALSYVQQARIATDYEGAKEFERGAEFALQFVPRTATGPSRQLDLLAAC